MRHRRAPNWFKKLIDEVQSIPAIQNLNTDVSKLNHGSQLLPRSFDNGRYPQDTNRLPPFVATTMNDFQNARISNVGNAANMN